MIKFLIPQIIINFTILLFFSHSTKTTPTTTTTTITFNHY